MKYENLKNFIISTKASKSTIYRFYKKNEELWNETKIPSGKRLFPIDHARYFDSEIMFDENKVLPPLPHESFRVGCCCLPCFGEVDEY